MEAEPDRADPQPPPSNPDPSPTHLDQILDEVLVGGRERRPIVIVDYDPAWPARFELERDRIQHALGDLTHRIEHIGSTSVPGLAAKPIVDLLVTVKDPGDESIRAAMEAAGYELRVREPDHRMFRTPERDVQVHIWPDSHAEVARYLRFRDRLRESPDDRLAYERLKRKLASRDWPDTNYFAEAKGELIEAIIARAR